MSNKQRFSRFSYLAIIASAIIGFNFQTVFAQKTNNSSNFAPTARVFDFDGDGKSDYTLVRDVAPGYLVWYIALSGGGYKIEQFGLNNDWLVPDDYDGDGKCDIAVWRQGDYYNPQGFFYIHYSQTDSIGVIPWGLWGDTPEKTQDFDGDDKADPAVVRFNPNGDLTWYILQSSNGQARVENFGGLGDGPIRGDFDGDGKADLAVRRCVNLDNYFVYRLSSGNLSLPVKWGRCTNPGDVTVSGDFDGDGKTDVAVYRWSTAEWWWKQSSNGQVRVQKFGVLQSDYPALADYDGDGKTDIAIWRETGFGNPSYFHTLGSTSGYSVYQWGSYADHLVSFDLMTH